MKQIGQKSAKIPGINCGIKIQDVYYSFITVVKELRSELIGHLPVQVN